MRKNCEVAFLSHPLGIVMGNYVLHPIPRWKASDQFPGDNLTFRYLLRLRHYETKSLQVGALSRGGSI